MTPILRNSLEQGLLVCPSCRGILAGAETSLECGKCGRVYPVFLDIPDLRPSVAEGTSPEENERLARLKEAYATTDWRGLIRLLYELSPGRTAAMKALSADYSARGVDRGADRLAMAEEISAARGWAFARERALDVGCSCGGPLAALARRFGQVVGLDIAPDQLLIARKLLEERGISNVLLVCGTAESMPFADGRFDLCTAFDLLHHVDNPEAVVGEAQRVLRRGVAVFDSFNPYAPFNPEPHVGLWGVGFLSAPWAEKYVFWRKGVSFKERHVRHLSLPALRRLLKKAWPGERLFYSPILWKREPRRFPRAVRALRARVPFLAVLAHRVFLLVSGGHLVALRKEGE